MIMLREACHARVQIVRCAVLVCSSVVLSAPQARGQAAKAEAPLRFEVTVPASVHAAALDGRVLLMIAKTNETEPRFQVGRGVASQPIFGIDVDGLRAGQPAVIDAKARVWPVESITGILAGNY